jgi:hypothetical protein
MYDKGDYKNAEDHKISKNTSDDFMTFDEYKRVADTINF